MFCDYDGGGDWVVGMVVDITYDPPDEDWKSSMPAAMVMHDNRVQPVAIPQKGQGWIEHL